jgi:hypothetical protein
VRLTRFPERVLTVVVSDASEPESVEMVELILATCPERVAIFPVAVAIFELILATVPERAFCARVSVK